VAYLFWAASRSRVWSAAPSSGVRIPAGPVFAVFKLDANTGMVLWPASVADFPYQTLRLVLLPCGLEQLPYKIASHLTFPTTTTLCLG
jgi:hypothetical protein